MNHFYTLAYGLISMLRIEICDMPSFTFLPLEQNISFRLYSLLGRVSCQYVFSACQIINVTGRETFYMNQMGILFLLILVLREVQTFCSGLFVTL